MAVEKISSLLQQLYNVSCGNACVFSNLGLQSVLHVAFGGKDAGHPSPSASKYGVSNWHPSSGDSNAFIQAFLQLFHLVFIFIFFSVLSCQL